MTPHVSEKELAALSLSPAEVSALLEIPERRVRKEIERGLAEDVEFARRYSRAYPRAGRPRESAKPSSR
jgi:hypothetical protein